MTVGTCRINLLVPSAVLGSVTVYRVLKRVTSPSTNLCKFATMNLDGI
jgi:hypothetical protein